MIPVLSMDSVHPEMADGSANWVEIKAREKFNHAIGVTYG
jgi:hypothetical protein